MSSASATPNWLISYVLYAYTAQPELGGNGTILTRDSGEPGAVRLEFEIHQSAISEGWWHAEISFGITSSGMPTGFSRWNAGLKEQRRTSQC